LNLTFEVREGIIKHSHDYNAQNHPELAEYLLDQRPPLEAQLIDLTDEIAYNTADLDDGYEAHLLTIEQIADSVDLFARHYREAKTRYPSAAEKLVFNETLKSILDGFVGDLIGNTAQLLEAANVHSVEDVRDHARRLAAFSPPVEEDRRRLKEFLYENLYYSPALAAEKEDAERITAELFAHWMEEPDDLPRNYRQKVAEEPLPRVICDYIAGMTDPFIYQQYEKYCGA
jgi:dGTPase